MNLSCPFLLYQSGVRQCEKHWDGMPANVLFLTTYPVEEARHWNLEVYEELLARGITTCFVPWRNSTLSATDICEYTHVVFLVCGYYIFYIEDFHKFIETVLLPAEALKPSLRIINHPSIVLWNSNKTYLQELEKEGFPVPHTQYFNATQSLKSLELAVGSHASHGPVVLKPSVSASGRSTHLIKDLSNLTENDRAFLLDITQKPQRGSIMLQEYISKSSAESILLYSSMDP